MPLVRSTPVSPGYASRELNGISRLGASRLAGERLPEPAGEVPGPAAAEDAHRRLLAGIVLQATSLGA